MSVFSVLKLVMSSSLAAGYTEMYQTNTELAMREARMHPIGLTRLMEECGFAFRPTLSGSIPTVVTDPFSCFTVAIDVDATLKEEFFYNYFVCESEAFGLVDAIDETAGDYWFDCVITIEDERLLAFLSGPGSWLLSRLLGRPELVLWASSTRPELNRDNCDNRRIDHSLSEPLLLSQIEPNHLVSLCASLMRTTYESVTDYWLLSPTLAELYCIHHHDKVILHVPKGAESSLELLGDSLSRFPKIRRVHCNRGTDVPAPDPGNG
jgi:hypothetical protein